VPGWALLSLRGAWRAWAPLQAWAVALALGVAFYPVLFFVVRLLPAGVTLGRSSLTLLLAGLGLAAAAALRRDARQVVRFSALEWLAVGVVAVTVGTRAWVAHLEPFPAWTDSLHHVLLTELTAAQGRLPENMEPYFAVPLALYHLGLYGATASVQLLAGVPAHTALLWVAQLLNGLCGLGVYLVLDRRVGRLPAVVGAIVAGLVSHQPAFYVNWGRFTQLAGQTVMLPAWLVAWEALRRGAHVATPPREAAADDGERRSGDDGGLAPLALHACLLVAGVLLLHYRVAIFFVVLLAATLAAELWRARDEPRVRRRLLAGAFVLGLGSLVLAGPGFLRAASGYAHGQWAAILFRGGLFATGDDRLSGDPEYFHFSRESIAYLAGGEATLLAVAALAAFALLRRNVLAAIVVAWTAALVALGEVHRLSVPLLNVTNAGAVLILLYLPASLLVAAGVHELLAWRGAGRPLRVATLGAFLVLGVVGARARVTELEPARFFVTPADLRAMRWIADNTAPNAVFAVRTVFWLPGFPHGTDAGYWIPYLAGRRTTVGPMIAHLGPRYANWAIDMGRMVVALPQDEAALVELYKRGVRYVYLGARGDPADAHRLAVSPHLALRYADGGAYVFEVDPG
jgi:hypothetical protein